MLDFSTWEIAGLAVNFITVCLLNRWYKSKTKDAEVIANTQTFDVGSELQSALTDSPDKVLPYACVCGVVLPIGAPIKSQHTDKVGVVLHELLVEHKSKRTQGFWTDVKSVIKDRFCACPFALVNADQNDRSGVRIEVIDATGAEYLGDSLQVTHDQFTATKDGFLQRSFDRLFGDVSKGYQETEKMLEVGVPVIGYGKLMMEGGKRITLNPPDDGHRYILTTSTRTELIRSLRSDARVLRIIFWVLTIAGTASFAYIVYRSVTKAWKAARERRLLDEHRLQRRVIAGSSDVTENQMICVVCLSQPRDVLLLECGHICLCSECALALPSPKLCPVCRASVDRIVPTFLS